jgi:type I restriction-modification system DNA methylase subunit
MLKLKNGLYALEEEQNAVYEFNQNHKNHPLFTGLPPQSFQGNPKAPVWILMLNPCYSENDEKYYNDVDKKERKNAIGVCK